MGVFLLSWKFFQSPEPVPCATPEFNATLHALDFTGRKENENPGL
jgi:hypothetical protein